MNLYTVEFFFIWNVSDNHDDLKMEYLLKKKYSAKIINLICENEAFTAFMYKTIIIKFVIIVKIVII